MRELFETLVRATSFGVCNVTARSLTITAPVIALSLHQPAPMLIVLAFSALAAALSLLARPIEEVSRVKGTFEEGDVEDDLIGCGPLASPATNA